MPYIIVKKNGKPYKWDRMRPLLSQQDVADFQRDGRRVGDCWTFKSPVTMRTVTVGACKTETPSNFWGARRRRKRR
ncbi:MAG TPA: hypothetical protein VGY48_15650 [Vicinamibacterales bacterium]|jgi:hypothetical protein|nr:hypothetical protein [Vicinamibacterales bacterium]